MKTARKKANARAPAAPAGGRAAWSRAVEAASLRMRDPLVESARANYGRIDDMALKMQLAREIAMTRGSELTLAYRNVVMVISGLRRRQVQGREELTDEPCVIFVVRRKWDEQAAGAAPPGRDGQRLPRDLLAIAEWKGHRILVAVPTDVQHESRHASARAHSANAIHVDPRNGGANEYGVLTTLVQVRTGGVVRRFGLSAMHVLSPTFPSHGAPAFPGGAVEQSQGNPQPPGAPSIGLSGSIGGQLVPAPDISFDAQLLELDNEDAARAMLAGLRLSDVEPYVGSPARFDQLLAADRLRSFEFLVPSNHFAFPAQRPQVFGTWSSTAPHSLALPYGTQDGGLIRIAHWELLEFQIAGGQATVPGDSGSAVVFWRDDGTCTLTGMHIAGDGSSAHVLPAWQLFSTLNWNPLDPRQDDIGPVPP